MAEAEVSGGTEPQPKKSIPLGVLLGVLNTLALLSLLGVLAYTKILYKRPTITETAEREKLAQETTKKPEDMKRVIVSFEPIQANLKPTPIGVQVPGGPPQQMKAHYLTMTLALELLDAEFESVVKGRQPKFLDVLLRELGSTSVDELATVQGRFLLRSKIAGVMNDLVREERKLPPTSSPVVTNVFFSDFVVQ